MTLREMIKAIMNELGIESEEDGTEEDGAEDETEDATEKE